MISIDKTSNETSLIDLVTYYVQHLSRPHTAATQALIIYFDGDAQAASRFVSEEYSKLRDDRTYEAARDAALARQGPLYRMFRACPVIPEDRPYVFMSPEAEFVRGVLIYCGPQFFADGLRRLRIESDVNRCPTCGSQGAAYPDSCCMLCDL